MDDSYFHIDIKANATTLIMKMKIVAFSRIFKPYHLVVTIQI